MPQSLSNVFLGDWLRWMGCSALCAGLWGAVSAQEPNPEAPQVLNDVHSRLNPTEVLRVIRPRGTEDVIEAVRAAKAEKVSLSISGARHSMGGQQFAQGALHLDMRSMNRFLELDNEKRLAKAEAGITWPELLQALEERQGESQVFLTFRQKQTGADDLTLGGAVSSNIHGRGLQWGPFVEDIESITLVNAEAQVVKASRQAHSELFRLAVGGYGLFGVITEVELRLIPRQRLERVVEIAALDGIMRRVDQRARDGFLFGDFQFCPDETSDAFLREGVFSCYRPLADAAHSEDPAVTLNAQAWRGLIISAHAEKPTAWAGYKTHYQRTNGQHYWHDRAQFSHYDADYGERIHAALPALPPGSLMISEVYVPRDRLEDFMAACAEDARRHATNIIYGTVRFIEQDKETFLPWARQSYACIVFNLRVTHTPEGRRDAEAAFRRLIDLALDRDGSFFLTYHRWATREQMLRAYPQFPQFLHHKLRHDPGELFQSEWYRHWRSMIPASP